MGDGPPGQLHRNALRPDLFRYAQLLPNLTTREGVICWDWNDELVPCIPEDLQGETIKRAHEAAGHMGEEPTAQRLRLVAYFPGMYRKVRSALAHCETCEAKRPPPGAQKHTLVS